MSLLPPPRTSSMVGYDCPLAVPPGTPWGLHQTLLSYSRLRVEITVTSRTGLGKPPDGSTQPTALVNEDSGRLWQDAKSFPASSISAPVRYGGTRARLPSRPMEGSNVECTTLGTHGSGMGDGGREALI